MGCLACGSYLLQGKGHRQRLYCSDVCRQRACRARNEHKETADNYQQLTEQCSIMQRRIDFLEGQLAESKAEIARLTYLLEAQTKKTALKHIRTTRPT